MGISNPLTLGSGMKSLPRLQGEYLLHDSAKLCNYDAPKRGEIEIVRLQQALQSLRSLNFGWVWGV